MGLMSDLGIASDLANVRYDRGSAYAMGLRPTYRTWQTFFVIPLQIGNGTGRACLHSLQTSLKGMTGTIGLTDRCGAGISGVRPPL